MTAIEPDEHDVLIFERCHCARYLIGAAQLRRNAERQRSKSAVATMVVRWQGLVLPLCSAGALRPVPTHAEDNASAPCSIPARAVATGCHAAAYWVRTKRRQGPIRLAAQDLALLLAVPAADLVFPSYSLRDLLDPDDRLPPSVISELKQTPGAEGRRRWDIEQGRLLSTATVGGTADDRALAGRSTRGPPSLC